MVDTPPPAITPQSEHSHEGPRNPGLRKPGGVRFARWRQERAGRPDPHPRTALGGGGTHDPGPGQAERVTEEA